jgi:argininosuccinate lyase
MPDHDRELPTGRIAVPPSQLIDETILRPQFAWDAEHLLEHYRSIELALLREHERLGLCDAGAATAIRRELVKLTAADLEPAPHNLSDLLFAIERHVLARVRDAPPTWHVDRSRNDVQACAHAMLARALALDAADSTADVALVAAERSAALADAVLPGFTHRQPAQVITAGFYLAAVAYTFAYALERLASLLIHLNRCPLGAGAMSGLELPWDRDALARALGFDSVEPNALRAVASREWASSLGAELAVTSVAVSRFVTDIADWTSQTYDLLDLPDEYASISSAMPQKRNFPILERIRGMTSHVVAGAFDVLVAQRSTSFTNSVEVSKESTRPFYDLVGVFSLMLVLLRGVLRELTVNEESALRAARDPSLAAATLANTLTLQGGVPTRAAHVAVGEWLAAGGDLKEGDGVALAERCAAAGYPLPADVRIAPTSNPRAVIAGKETTGSTRPDAVREQAHAAIERVHALRAVVSDTRRKTDEAASALRAT